MEQRGICKHYPGIWWRERDEKRSRFPGKMVDIPLRPAMLAPVDSLNPLPKRMTCQDYSGPEARSERKSVMVEGGNSEAKPNDFPRVFVRHTEDGREKLVLAGPEATEYIEHNLGGGSAFFTPYVSFSQEKNTEGSSL